MATEQHPVLSLDIYDSEHAYTLARQTTRYPDPATHYHDLNDRYGAHEISDNLLLTTSALVAVVTCRPSIDEDSWKYASAFHYGSVLGLAVAENVGGPEIIDMVAVEGNASTNPQDLWAGYKSQDEYVRAALDNGQAVYEQIRDDYAVLDAWTEAFALEPMERYFHQGFGWLLHLTGSVIHRLQLDEMQRMLEGSQPIDWDEVGQAILMDNELRK